MFVNVWSANKPDSLNNGFIYNFKLTLFYLYIPVATSNLCMLIAPFSPICIKHFMRHWTHLSVSLITFLKLFSFLFQISNVSEEKVRETFSPKKSSTQGFKTKTRKEIKQNEIPKETIIIVLWITRNFKACCS